MIEQNARRTIAALVLMGHVLVLLLLDELIREKPPIAGDVRNPILFFVWPAVSERVPEKRSNPSTQRPSRDHSIRLAPPSVPQVEEPASATIPRIDWTSEATQAARSAIESQQSAESQKFSQAQKDKPKKTCARPRPPQWRPELPKYGFAGGLPFMRFHDDRCIFLLVFVGCGFGAKPQADGHLFDKMNIYPNDSSVPDLDECDESED